MSVFENIVKRDKLVESLGNEYRKLLSVKISDVDAERLIVDYFTKAIEMGSPQEGYMWLALAQCEWELGRLSSYVKEKACYWISAPNMEFTMEEKDSMLGKLDSPIPKKKRIRTLSHISHCPWPVGSLLAYRIISSKHPYVTQSPFYGKYVLLRIIQIKRHPVSNLVPDALWNESMLVGLYDWIGDRIPESGITDHLSFTAISIREPVLLQSVLQSLPIDMTSERAADIMQQLIQRTTTQRIESCCDLSWKCAKGIHRDDIFTFLECDPTFQSSISPFFRTNITDYSMCHSIPFDAVLVNRFSQLSHNSN